MLITKGTSFRTIQEAMLALFNKKSGCSSKHACYMFKTSKLTVWFPKAARAGSGGRLAPPSGQKLLNVLSVDEKEIIEWNTQPNPATCHPSKNNDFPRITFIKDGDKPYVFKGVYALSLHSADYRSRVYTKIADIQDTNAVSGEMEVDDFYESAE
jgi:hypothetical protein